MKIECWSEKRDGKFSENAFKKKIEKLGFSVSRYVYSPGTHFGNHAHEVDKIDGVVSGRFKMTTMEGEVILEAGDMLFVPRGTVHSAEVIGNQPVLSLDAVKW